MSNLKIAIQKKGRLKDKSISLLQECGIKIASGTSTLKAQASNFPIELLYLRDDDIPHYVEQGVADIGIVGENEVLEKNKQVATVEKLGFAGCRMSLAIPKGEQYEGLQFFRNKRVATSYPRILQSYFQDNEIEAEIEEIGGSVEIAPSIGLAQGVFDIVSTGSTLLSNGLVEVETVLKSEAVLIANNSLDQVRQTYLDQLLFRMKAVRAASSNKYIVLNAPNTAIEAIAQLLPGMKSPTVLPLKATGWSSIHSVVREDEFWDVIDKLRLLGAEGILVVPIEKMIN